MFCLHYLDSCSSHTWMSIYTCLHTHTVTRGWSVAQWTSSPALLHVLSFILHSFLSQPLVAAQLPVAAGAGTKAAFVLSLQRHYHEPCPATVSGTHSLTCPPVQMLMNWDIVLISFLLTWILCCMCSFKKHLKDDLLCHFLCGFSVSWNSSHAVLIIIVGYEVKVYLLNINIKQLGLWYVKFLRHKSCKLKLCFTQRLHFVW